MSVTDPGASCLYAMESRPHDRRLRRRPGGAGSWTPRTKPVAGMSAGDDRAAEVFVQRHERRVFGIALAITADRVTAEDVAQEAFVRAWRHAAVFDPLRASAISWLSTITRNLAIDTLPAPKGHTDRS